jgi:hypothetical protein
MYAVYRHYQDGTILFVGTTDDPTEMMDSLRPNNRRNLNRSFIVIEPN